MAGDLSSFAADMVRLGDAFNSKEIGNAIGEMATEEAEAAASADLGGDPKFSGWAPTLDTEFKLLEPTKVLLKPTRHSAGPWTVAQQGRNRGNAPGFQGPGVNRRTGLTSRTKAGNVRKTRAFRAKQWNGVTAGKGTADDAHRRIQRRMPDVVEVELNKSIRKTLGPEVL